MPKWIFQKTSGDSDVQINRRSWVKGRKTNRGQGKNMLPDRLNWRDILQVAQKAIMKNQFLSYFWNPLIK